MLDALAAGAPAEPLARYFECWLLRLQGVYPEARGIAVGRGAGVSRGLARVPPHRVGDVAVDRRVLRELEAVHRALIAMHLEKTLKSDRVLRDLRRHATTPRDLPGSHSQAVVVLGVARLSVAAAARSSRSAPATTTSDMYPRRKRMHRWDMKSLHRE